MNFHLRYALGEGAAEDPAGPTMMYLGVLRPKKYLSWYFSCAYYFVSSLYQVNLKKSGKSCLEVELVIN